MTLAQHLGVTRTSTARFLERDTFSLACLPHEAFYSLDAPLGNFPDHHCGFRVFRGNDFSHVFLLFLLFSDYSGLWFQGLKTLANQALSTPGSLPSRHLHVNRRFFYFDIRNVLEFSNEVGIVQMEFFFSCNE